MSEEADPNPAADAAPIQLLALCREASRFAPLAPVVQRALHDALTLCAFHFDGHSSFFAANHRNAESVTKTLTDWVAERSASQRWAE